VQPADPVEVSLQLDGPRDAPAQIVLAHGAGAGMHSEFMATVAQGLARRGLRVCRFEFPYMRAGRRSPDRQPILEDAYRDAVSRLRRGEETAPLFVGGKSLGGRIASHVVADVDAKGVFFLGYPLHPPGKPERARIANLAVVSAPMLFVQGTRAPFCPRAELDRFLAPHPGPAEIVVVEDGDHSLKVRPSSGRSTAEAWQQAVDAVADWIGSLSRG